MDLQQNKQTKYLYRKELLKRESKGLDWDNFGVQAQAQYAGGDAERWNKHAETWRNLGASHLAIATHNAEPTNVEGHLGRIKEYLNAVT